MLNKTETPLTATGPRLDHLDGLRGLAALYVVLFHCRTEFTWRQADGGFSPLVRSATSWLDFGHYAVVVFIVLSGYCLMLPVVRSPDKRPAGGLRGYLARRAWRTLPAYYGAVAFSLLLTAIFPALRHKAGAQWDRCLPAFRPDVLASHLLLLHNLRFTWHQTIDAPLWSMATEWDIYLVFALLLLPLWRRGGTVVATGAAILLGLLPHLFLPPGANFDWACPWFLGCFALGMAGATVCSPPEATGLPRRTVAVWPVLGSLLGAAVVLICGVCPAWGGAHWVNVDMLVAGAGACALVATARPGDTRGRTAALALRCLASRPLRALGGFSYSLYLTHFPLLALIHALLRHAALTPDAAYLCLCALAIPASLLTAWAFARVFEPPPWPVAAQPMPIAAKSTPEQRAA